MNDAEVRLKIVVDTSGAEQSINNIQSKMASLGQSFTNTGKKLTMGLTLPIVGLVTAGVAYNAEIEQLKTSFEVMTGSADEAANIIQKLKKVGAKTPYELKGLAKTTQTLMQYGLTSEEAYDATLNFGDIAQGSAEKMQSIAYAYGQMSSAGKVNMQDIKQMINAGFNPLQAIADRTGKTMEEVTLAYEAGTISVEDITKAMKYSSSANGRYFKSMDKQSQTTAGKLSTLKDNFNEATGALTESLLPIINDVIKGLSDFASWFSKLDKGQRDLILTILGVVAVVGPLLVGIGQIANAVVALDKVFTILSANPLYLQITILIAALAVLYDSYMKVTKAVNELNATTDPNQAQSKENIKTTEQTTKSATTQEQKDRLLSLYGTQLERVRTAIYKQNVAIINAKRNPLGYYLVKDSLNSSLTNYKNEEKTLIDQIKALGGVPKLSVGTNNVGKDGLAFLHQGEAVVPKKYNPAMGGTQTLFITMGDIVMDGRTVGRSLTPYITKTVKVGGGNV
jgi:tape measure domain-containing protein